MFSTKGPLMRTTTSIMRKHVPQSYSYYDRVDYYDMRDHCFFVYDLSRYNNRHHYYYGDTRDMTTTELILAHSVPVYKLALCVPVEEYMGSSDFAKFEASIQPFKTKLPILDSPNVFALDDVSIFDDVTRHLRLLSSG